MDQTQLHIETVVEADFCGRLQTLTLDEAELRLHRALQGRRAGLEEKQTDPQLDDYWREMGYRSITYDAAGLTAAMAREFPEQAYEIIGAHMDYMRSALANADTPAVNGLFALLAKLKTDRHHKERKS